VLLALQRHGSASCDREARTNAQYFGATHMRPTTTEKTFLILYWLFTSVFLILGPTLWRRRIIERYPPGAPMWFWLRLLGIPESQANRARLLMANAALGITMVSVVVVVVLLMGLE